ncbi:MAG: hypothetical protein ACUVTP_00380 [Candidatus Fervidibacter sp.]|uniref:hypothetical protein n=1 Tax=Candidatus Fervidibacter sp. TaxID=3100871 RepID=UPI0040494881
MSRVIFDCGLTSLRLSAGKNLLGSDKEVDIVKVIAFGFVHRHRLLLTGKFFCGRIV